jgi:hypothetical protein
MKVNNHMTVPKGVLSKEFLMVNVRPSLPAYSKGFFATSAGLLMRLFRKPLTVRKDMSMVENECTVASKSVVPTASITRRSRASSFGSSFGLKNRSDGGRSRLAKQNGITMGTTQDSEYEV